MHEIGYISPIEYSTSARNNNTNQHDPTSALLYLVAHAEDAVDVLHELERGDDLALDLVLAAEDVSVVLAETPHPSETRQGPAQLQNDDNKKTTKNGNNGNNNNNNKNVGHTRIHRTVTGHGPTACVQLTTKMSRKNEK